VIQSTLSNSYTIKRRGEIFWPSTNLATKPVANCVSDKKRPSVKHALNR
jgi:hypothetical protein